MGAALTNGISCTTPWLLKVTTPCVFINVCHLDIILPLAFAENVGLFRRRLGLARTEYPHKRAPAGSEMVMMPSGVILMAVRWVCVLTLVCGGFKSKILRVTIAS